jgi:hypothetical protein
MAAKVVQGAGAMYESCQILWFYLKSTIETVQSLGQPPKPVQCQASAYKNGRDIGSKRKSPVETFYGLDLPLAVEENLAALAPENVFLGHDRESPFDRGGRLRHSA